MRENMSTVRWSRRYPIHSVSGFAGLSGSGKSEFAFDNCDPPFLNDTRSVGQRFIAIRDDHGT
jgi:hypothetical protein